MLLDVRVDIKEAERYLTGLRKDQIPFATAYALTSTAKDAQKNIVATMERVFDRPKPYTLNGTYVKAATKRDLTAVVKLKDGYLGESPNTKKGTADQYLRAEVQGGARRNTAFEKALIYNGLMPPGYFAIPTKFAPKDSFGNVPPGFYTRMISQLGIGDELQRANKNKAKAQRRSPIKTSSPLQRAADFERKERRRKQRRLAALVKPKKRASYPIFNVYPMREKNKHLKPGIYERVSSGFSSNVRPMFIYVSTAPKYKKRLDFNRIVSDTVAARLVANFEAGFRLADATKR